MDRQVDAVSGCVECELRFCSECLLDHNNSQALRGHQIVDKAEMMDRFCKNEAQVFETAQEVKKDANKPPTYKPFSAYHVHGNFNIRVSTDRQTCNIVDLCLLLDGSLILTDKDNWSLKRIDTVYNIVDYLNFSKIPGKFPPEPWGVCRTSQSEVAVSMSYDEKIQFVSTEGKLSLTKSFDVGIECYFVAFSNKELFVTCGGGGGDPGQVRVFSLTGEHLRTFLEDASGEIFFNPYGITVSRDGNRLHVADTTKGVITIDTAKGTRLWNFTDRQLESAWGICTGASDNISCNEAVFVSGAESSNIMLITMDGEKIGELLGEEDGIDLPNGICYDEEHSKLTVTQYSDFVKVFHLYGTEKNTGT